MAQIHLKNLAHSYAPKTEHPSQWALKEMDHVWEQGGAYALLGPSGCGKTTLLNLISGLLTPTRGQVLFDGQDMSGLAPEERNIAQVFQFPVVYDTMTVYDNLAFPLRNRGMGETKLEPKVREVAEMLELTGELSRKAASLPLDMKQKISMGRGLVRDGVNAILFDEPLTVIDPQLKWELRYQLKQLHRRFDHTMIYVTHDQTEALTFADQIAVMFEGRIAQMGTPTELFENPVHTFVGKFIGSPGINLLPCTLEEGNPCLGGHKIELGKKFAEQPSDTKLRLGIRPEYIRFAEEGIGARVTRIQNLGAVRLVELELDGMKLKATLPSHETVSEGAVRLRFDPEKTRVYANDWMLKGETHG